MATGRHHQPPGDEDPSPGATEPITLTDPDGAVTLVAPWSTWTREQVRAPGGEPALVTRLEQGQLWFSAGRRRSPWRHEVRIGAVSISAPEGRFHVTAEPDGGATVDCLAGRTRVVAGLQEPVILGPQQTAAVASDGGTLVVLDNGDGTEPTPGPTDADPLAPSATATAVAATAASSAVPGEPPMDAPGVADAPLADASDAEHPGAAAPVVGSGGSGDGGSGDEPPPAEDDVPRPRPSRLPELVSVAALLAVLVAGIVVFGRHSNATDTVDVAAPVSSSTTLASSTTAKPTTTTTAPRTTTTTPVTTSTSTTSPPNLSNPAIASGALASCRRSDGGVVATIKVSLTSGGPGRFKVGVGLVGADGAVFARGEAKTAMISEGGSAPVDVQVNVPGPIKGACELLGVEAA